MGGYPAHLLANLLPVLLLLPASSLMPQATSP